jgi:hypothetical protein
MVTLHASSTTKFVVVAFQVLKTVGWVLYAYVASYTKLGSNKQANTAMLQERVTINLNSTEIYLKSSGWVQQWKTGREGI